MPKLPTWRQMHMDTSPAVEAVQFAALRTWPLWRKLAMTAALTRTARGAVWAGICQRYPAVSTHTLQQHFSDILYGAASVYVSQHQLFEESAMQDLDLIDVTLHVTTVLEQLGVDYVVVGSLASTLYGIPRSTVDADLVADLRPEHVGALVDALKDAFCKVERPG